MPVQPRRLRLVSPRTLLRWHADLAARRSTYPRPPGRPAVPPPTRALVLRMAMGEPHLGLPPHPGRAGRIRPAVAASTVWKILKGAGLDPAPRRSGPVLATVPPRAGPRDPGGLHAGSLLKLRTGRGVWHAEGRAPRGQDRDAGARPAVLGEPGAQDKGVEPSARLLQPQDVPVRQHDNATILALVGEDSLVELGTPGLVLDIELPTDGSVANPVPPGFNAFVYLLDGEATVGANRCPVRRSQIAVLGLGRCARRGGRAARNTVRAHGREALRRNADLQRTVCRLTCPSTSRRLRLPREGGPNDDHHPGSRALHRATR